jgi:hypothetical protein
MPHSGAGSVIVGTSSSVIIHDHHVVRIAIAPFEADPPLAIDPDAELPEPVTAQRFQAVAWQSPQILERAAAVQNLQSLFRLLSNALEPTNPPVLIKASVSPSAKLLIT